MSFFDRVSLAPQDPIFGLSAAFKTDPRTNKVDLSVGVYKTTDLETPMMRCVKQAEQWLVENEKSKEYLPIQGDKEFIEKIGVLVFGQRGWSNNCSRMCGAQALGGTGALRIGAEFLKQEIGANVFVSEPTWPNHWNVFLRAGMNVTSYPYYDSKQHSVSFSKFYDFLQTLSERSIIVFHACCHNPTGLDPSIDQWEQISKCMSERNLIPFFDFAYQGLHLGLEEDAQSVRLFLDNGHEMFVGCSFSKNFSLYGERIGAFFVVCGAQKYVPNVESQIKSIIRGNFSNPPLHGARIIRHILSSPELKHTWEIELSHMRERIKEMRRALTAGLLSRGKKTDYSFLNQGGGIFSFCGLRKEQVERLIADYGIYMTGDGRINIAGLNSENLEYVIDAILAVSEGYTQVT